MYYLSLSVLHGLMASSVYHFYFMMYVSQDRWSAALTCRIKQFISHAEAKMFDEVILLCQNLFIALELVCLQLMQNIDQMLKNNCGTARASSRGPCCTAAQAEKQSTVGALNSSFPRIMSNVLKTISAL